MLVHITYQLSTSDRQYDAWRHTKDIEAIQCAESITFQLLILPCLRINTINTRLHHIVVILIVKVVSQSMTNKVF